MKWYWREYSGNATQRWERGWVWLCVFSNIMLFAQSAIQQNSREKNVVFTKKLFITGAQNCTVIVVTIFILEKEKPRKKSALQRRIGRSPNLQSRSSWPPGICKACSPVWWSLSAVNRPKTAKTDVNQTCARGQGDWVLAIRFSLFVWR